MNRLKRNELKRNRMGAGNQSAAGRRKRKLGVGLAIALLLIAGMISYFYIRTKLYSNEYMTYAEFAKLMVYGCVDLGSIEQTEKENDAGYWYESYMKLAADLGIGRNVKASAYVSKKDVYTMFCEGLGISEQTVSTEAGKKLALLKDSREYIAADECNTLYLQLLAYMPYGSEIKRIEAGIAGTPGTLDKADEWQVYTTKGVLQFRGFVLDDHIDKTMSLIVRGDEVIAIDGVMSDSAEYKNIWIKTAQGSVVETNVYGADRTFSIQGVSENVQNSLADIQVENGKIKAISIKNDEIQGKVFSVSKDYVEIDGYGRVPLDESFMIYDIYNGFSVKTYEDIVVGYSLQNFIVANGQVCGAVISRELNADNIRVILKNNAADSIFYDGVSVTAEVPYTISYGEVAERHEAGEVYTINSENPAAGERITAEADNGAQMTVLNVNRSQGVPGYEGRIEVSLYDGGYVIVNDVDIEKYLKRVVPSEMPVSFGVEALKVQAVCARSYAYNQLTNSYYSGYGAHVDDTTLFQVYNNSAESEASNEAIAQTRGQVLRYGTDVVQTYYYSTSCGTTTDVGLWGSDPASYPFFQSRDVSRTVRNLNLTDENTFEQFITSKDENDYDYNCSLYRWELDASIDKISSVFNEKLYGRYLAAPAKVLTQKGDGSFVSQKITSVGRIQNILVDERANGGAVTSVIVIGSEATVKIESESCIRTLFGCSDVTMTTNTGTTQMASLPSTFCFFKVIHAADSANEQIKIFGGGYGHGIGMSQNAVKAMTEDGMDYIKILQFFYNGTAVGTYH